MPVFSKSAKVTGNHKPAEAAAGSSTGKQFVSSWCEKGAPMLGFLFGFNARLGRMHYFLATIALAIVMTAICFTIASYIFQNTPRGALRSESLMTWPTLVAIAFFAWMTFTLQSMRIRDIGWDPVCVIPAWIAILIIDKLIAGKIPAWSLGHDHNGTVVGGLVNLGLILALLFWPGGDYERPFNDAYRSPDGPAPRTPSGTPSRANAKSVAAERIARASKTEFGNRAF
jgi:uncharacterized membrane protein YhaH (DUF805 family)